MAKAKAAKWKVIQRKVWKSKQAIELLAIYQIGPLKLKVEMDRDCYDFQSYARISVYDMQRWQWNGVTCLPGWAPTNVSYAGDPDIKVMDRRLQSDEKELVNMALTILS